MKLSRTICMILLAAFLAASVCCGVSAAPADPTPTPEPTPAPVLEADTVIAFTPEPTEEVTLAPVPTPSPTPEPTPTPTPTPTPVPEKIGIIRYALTDQFSDTVIDTDDVYRDESHSITVTRVETTDRTGKTLVYFVADIYVQDVESIARSIGGTDLGSLRAKYINKFAEECGAIVAMSGDYCTTSDLCYSVVNGELVYRTKKFNRDLCVLFRDGEMRTYSPEEIPLAYLEERGVWQTWNFGPMLLSKDGEPMQKFNSPDHVQERNPRAALGYYEPGHYCFVLVDGRQNGYSMGLSLEELSVLMHDLGCVAAYNLDGGISAQIAWHAKRINQPGKDRAIVDIVYVPYPQSEAPEEGSEP